MDALPKEIFQIIISFFPEQSYSHFFPTYSLQLEHDYNDPTWRLRLVCKSIKEAVDASPRIRMHLEARKFITDLSSKERKFLKAWVFRKTLQEHVGDDHFGL